MSATDPGHLQGRLAGATLASGDLDASLWFYRNLLGMEVIATEYPSAQELERSWGIAAPGGPLVTLSGGSRQVGLLRLLDVSSVAGEPIRSHPSIADPGPLALDFAVADLDDAHATLSAHGYEFYSPPLDVTGGVRICFCIAPDRVKTALIEFAPVHPLRAYGRQFVGLINVAQVVERVEGEREWYCGCFDMHTTLDYVLPDNEQSRRLSTATRTPPGCTPHLVNLAEREGIDGFQGGGTIEIIEPIGGGGSSVAAEAAPPRRGFFLTSIRVPDLDATHARVVAGGAPLLTELMHADAVTPARHFVTRSPTGSLLEVCEA